MAGKRRRDDIHLTPDVTYITNPDVAHEESDVPVGPVARFVAALAVFFVVVCLLMLLLYNFFERRAVRGEREASPLARQGGDRLPPEPRLQLAPGFGVTTGGGQRVNLSNDPSRKAAAPQPQAEYWAVRDEWNRQLNEYGWADEGAQTVRLTAERAKELYLQRQQQKTGGAQPQTPTGGQPHPPPGGAQGAHGETLPAASSSGQTTEQKHQ